MPLLSTCNRVACPCGPRNFPPVRLAASRTPACHGLWALNRQQVQCRAVERDQSVSSTSRPASNEADLLLHLNESAQPMPSQSSPAPRSPDEDDSSTHAAPAGASSWESWLKVFEQMDKMSEKQEELQQALQVAVVGENYSRAATLQRELKQLSAEDPVAGVREQLAAALQEERYADAARIRDEGLAALQGWWSGKDESDMQGHLLHIVPEYGRYTGRVYSARDVAEAVGWKHGDSRPQRLRSSSKGGGGGATAAAQGSPAMEVFLARPTPDAPLMHQAVSLVVGADARTIAREASPSPSPMPTGFFSTTSTSTASNNSNGTTSFTAAGAKSSINLGADGVAGVAAISSMLGLGPLMRLTVEISGDGSASIRAVPAEEPTITPAAADLASRASTAARPDRDGSSSSSSSDLRAQFSTAWEAEEAEATMRALAAAAKQSTSTTSSSTAADTSSTNANEQEAAAARELQPVQEVEVTEVIAGRELPDEQLRIMEQIASLASVEAVEGQADGREGSSERQADEGLVVDIGAAAGAVELDATVVSEDEEEAVSMMIEAPDADADADAPDADGDSISSMVAELGGDSDREDEDSLFTELHRAPAVLEMQGLDQFQLRVQRDHDSGGFSIAGASPFGSREVASGRSSWYSNGLQRAAAAAGPASTSQASGASETSTTSARSSSGVAARFEVLVPVGRFGGAERASAAIALVAERVARRQLESSQQASLPVDSQALQEALQSLAKNLAAGLACEAHIPGMMHANSSTSSAAGSSSSSTTTSASTSSEAYEPAARTSASSNGSSFSRDVSRSVSPTPTRTVAYKRLPTNRTTDLFEGLYVGSFGQHGPEVLRLQRVWEDGEEAVVVTKVTGDANVPAGQVSFKAKIGRKHKLSTRDVYPEELGATARYKGKGRVAQRGYSQPKWVDGELLVFSPSSPLAAGSQLGFVWAVPHERKFLILLNKVDLSLLAPSAADSAAQAKQQGSWRRA